MRTTMRYRTRGRWRPSAQIKPFRCEGHIPYTSVLGIALLHRKNCPLYCCAIRPQQRTGPQGMAPLKNISMSALALTNHATAFTSYPIRVLVKRAPAPVTTTLRPRCRPRSTQAPSSTDQHDQEAKTGTRSAARMAANGDEFAVPSPGRLGRGNEVSLWTMLRY